MMRAHRALRITMKLRERAHEVRQVRPYAVYVALGHGETIRFLKAHEDVGLFHRIPLIAGGVEPAQLQALGLAFSGLIVSARWAAGVEIERSMPFVESFRARYGRTPSSYAMQGYDAALLLDAALWPSAGDLAKALSAAGVEGVAAPIRAANGFAATD